MIDVRCKGCDRLLAKAETMNAAIKCPRCKMIFEYKLYSNLHVTNQYDPSETKLLLIEKKSDSISLEPSKAKLH